MLVFGFGISTDVNNLTFAVLDHDQSHESRAYLEELRGLDLFRRKSRRSPIMPISKSACKAATSRPRIEIPPGFGRDIERGRPAWVGAWVDGAMPFRAQTIRGYLQAMHQLYLTDPAVKTTTASAAAARRHRDQVQIQPGFRKRLRDGAVEHVAACWRCFRRS